MWLLHSPRLQLECERDGERRDQRNDGRREQRAPSAAPIIVVYTGLRTSEKGPPTTSRSDPRVPIPVRHALPIVRWAARATTVENANRAMPSVCATAPSRAAMGSTTPLSARIGAASASTSAEAKPRSDKRSVESFPRMPTHPVSPVLHDRLDAEDERQVRQEEHEREPGHGTAGASAEAGRDLRTPSLLAAKPGRTEDHVLPKPTSTSAVAQ